MEKGITKLKLVTEGLNAIYIVGGKCILNYKGLQKLFINSYISKHLDPQVDSRKLKKSLYYKLHKELLLKSNVNCSLLANYIVDNKLIETIRLESQAIVGYHENVITNKHIYLIATCTSC